MKSMLWAVVGVAVLVSGCRSVQTPGRTSVPAIGRPIQPVIQASAGLQIEMFDQAGKQVQELPRQQKGSVSIYNEDKTSQDNYTFDENGLIVKHRRSSGANYSQGIWEEAK